MDIHHLDAEGREKLFKELAEWLCAALEAGEIADADANVKEVTVKGDLTSRG